MLSTDLSVSLVHVWKMGIQSISPSSSSLQWHLHRLQWTHRPLPFLHNNQYRVYASSSWRRRRQRRPTLLLDKSAALVRRGRTVKAGHGVEGPTSADSSDDLAENDEKNDHRSGGGGGNGTVAGAVAMIVGTSIGTGMLALPQRTSPAGFLPTSASMIICWCFLLFEALLLVEVNVNLLKRKRKTKSVGNNGNGRSELEIVSMRTMAKETLGEWGGALATVTYIFFGYTSMVAYCSKSGEILGSLVNLPASASACFFTILFTLLIVVGGTRTTDHVNQWLTACMIGLLVVIEVLALAFGGWAGPGSSGDWGEVPPAIPVMIFSLVYHDIAPVLCAYLDGDITRIRTSVILGSLIPLVALLVWEAVALGLSSSVADQGADPIELLMRVRWSGVPFMVEAFSLLAVGTSMIGTLLSFSEFFKEQLNHGISTNLHSLQSPKTLVVSLIFLVSFGVLKKTKALKIAELEQQCSKPELGLRSWWERNRTGLAAMVLAVGPSLFLSTKFPDAFSAATDVTGGYCMTMLYGVLPPAMAWAMHDKKDGFADQMTLSTLRPALIGVGMFASGIVVEQILQDFSVLDPLHI